MDYWKMVYTNIYISQVNNMGIKKDKLIWSKNAYGLDQIVEDPSTTSLLARLL